MIKDTAGPYVMLHIGIGAFHRAHQAWYVHHLLELGETDWSLAVGSIRSDMSALLTCLARQDGAYTLETVSPDGERHYERIRSIRRVIPWEPDLAELIRVGAEERTQIISFTVTESGYYLDDKHRLDRAQPDLATDLQDGRVTIYGTIAAIVRQRMAGGGGPLTLLNCDNLRSNGDRFHAGLLEFLTLRNETGVVAWLAENASFPNAMVDRITPKPSDDVRPRVLAATGFDDGCPVMAENFIQWVIEDAFRAKRPAFEKAGAQIVESVAPYEEAKIRLLNASHACIAWAGTLRGYRYISEGTTDDAIRTLAYDYVTADAIPCLSPSPIDLAAYRDQVLDRFSNPYIRDTNERVAADGYAKILGWIVPTLTTLLERGMDPSNTATLPALFYLFLERWHRNELPYSYRDGVMDVAAAHAMFAAPDPLRAFSRDRTMLGALAGRPELLDAMRRRVEALRAWETPR